MNNSAEKPRLLVHYDVLLPDPNLVEPAPHPQAIQMGGGADVVLNTLTSPGMVAASLALLRPNGRFVEISKRDISSAARISQERPDVRYSLLAIDFLPPEVLQVLLRRLSRRLACGELQPIRSIIHPLASVAAAMRQMSQARHVGKIVVSSATTQPSVGPAGHSPGAIVITGGLGAIGGIVARWVATQDSGGRHIILVGRTGHLPAVVTASSPPKVGSSAVAVADWSTPLRQQLSSEDGPLFATRVTALMCDAGTAEGLEGLAVFVASIGETITCVMHAGGVLADASLLNQTLAGEIRTHRFSTTNPAPKPEAT